MRGWRMGVGGAVLAVLAGLVAGCGSEGPGGPVSRPSSTGSAAQPTAFGVTERVGFLDLIDAHLAPGKGRTTVLELTLANTDARRDDALTKVTNPDAGRARITGPHAGPAPGRVPLPATEHVGTAAAGYRIAFDTAASKLRPGSDARVTFTFTHSGTATVTLPVLPH